MEIVPFVNDADHQSSYDDVANFARLAYIQHD